MKLPINKRLLCCASLVPAKSRVADVGCDHGYLGIHLLLTGQAAFVRASDVRPMPLDCARKNAARFAVADRMDFRLADGLTGLDPDSVDAIVCAGMGGDLMLGILDAAPWLKDRRYALILQPQSAQNVFRRRLCEEGFCIEAETLVEDAGHLYTVLRARWDGVLRQLTPAEQYLTPQLLEDGSPLLQDYIDKVTTALSITIRGLQAAETPQEGRLLYCRMALEGLLERKERL